LCAERNENLSRFGGRLKGMMGEDGPFCAFAFGAYFGPDAGLEQEEAIMSYRMGVYFWGEILIIWLVAVGAALIAPNSTWSCSLARHDSMAAAITAVLGVIWSWFLKLDQESNAPVQSTGSKKGD
jgi:hypothetical protein